MSHATPSSSHQSHRFRSSRTLAAFALLALTVAGLSSLSVQRTAAAPAPGATATAATTTQATAAAAAAVPQLTPELAKLLAEIKAKDKGQFAVSEEDGRFLRLLVASSSRKHALEIGAASGYSAIWIGLGLRETGGRLTTIEYDPVRGQEALDNVKRAGLSDIVTVIKGDAFKEIPKLQGTFDVVFVDAWKRDYIKFFDMTYPRLDKGGIFLGHNVINKKSEMSDFLTRITTHPDLFTAIVAPGSEGISLSYKKR